MIDFDNFYNGLLRGENFTNKNYWEKFPKGHLLCFKEQTLHLLQKNIIEKDENGLGATLTLLLMDGADKDYTEFLLKALNEDWHREYEGIVEVLEIIKDPKSVDQLYNTAVNVPDYDEMCALAKKCMWALSAINTPEAVQKLELLAKVDDPIIQENAKFQLEQVLKKN